MQNNHCPMIHNGLQIDLKRSSSAISINHCCLRPDLHNTTINNIWNNPSLIPLRKLNLENEWDPGCESCRSSEAAGFDSLRTGTLKMFGKQPTLTGPQRLDLMFDIGCNLACRTCNEFSSTYWQKHLTDNNIPFSAPTPESKVDQMIKILKTLDLSNLELVVFSGGETLLGSGYWTVVNAIAELAPHAKDKIILSFQTNGTQKVPKKYYKLIEKFHLLKLNISLDGIDQQFEYLRWPANWNQVTDNIFNLRETLPENTMFLIEETFSIFNLYYHNRLTTWAQKNFSTNRLGDITNHTSHVANGIFSLDNITQEYYHALPDNLQALIPKNWNENPVQIRHMLDQILKFDQIRNQNWTEVFPEVSAFYSKYL
jgi:sulfatase maturation enzyme AslB (radical SAM superfamily)